MFYVLLDLENVVWQIREDTDLPETRKTPEALATGVIVIEEVIRELSPDGDVERVAAFSVPSPLGSTTEILRVLEQNRYLPLVTTRGPDQADRALKKMAALMLDAKTEDECLFVTGDGRGPFPELVRYARSQHKKVHLAAYAAIPPSLAVYGNAKQILLAGRIAEKLPRAKRMPRHSPEERPLRPPIVASAHKIANSLGREETDPAHQAAVKTLVSVVEKVIAVQRREQWGFSELIRAIMRYWPDTPPPEDDVRGMVNAIKYKLFQDWRSLRWQPDEQFLEAMHK